MLHTALHNSIQLQVTPQTASLSQTMKPIVLVAKCMTPDKQCHLTSPQAEKMRWCRMFPGSVWSAMMSYSPVLMRVLCSQCRVCAHNCNVMCRLIVKTELAESCHERSFDIVWGSYHEAALVWCVRVSPRHRAHVKRINLAITTSIQRYSIAIITFLILG